MISCKGPSKNSNNEGQQWPLSKLMRSLGVAEYVPQTEYMNEAPRLNMYVIEQSIAPAIDCRQYVLEC